MFLLDIGLPLFSLMTSRSGVSDILIDWSSDPGLLLLLRTVICSDDGVFRLIILNSQVTPDCLVISYRPLDVLLHLIRIHAESLVQEW